MNKTILFTTLALLIGLLIGVSLARQNLNNTSAGVESAGNDQSERAPLYWVAPMDPNYRRDEPGLSPMGMELIPVYEETGAQSDGIQVSAAIQQNLGLRTAPVTRGDLFREIETLGYTSWNGESIHMLHSRADGWLEVFNLTSVGDAVEAGQVIYELFSPALVSAQREYLNVQENASLAALARDRLLALGFGLDQIEALRRTGEISQRLVYRAQRDGVVTAIGVREGNYITPATLIGTLASLDTIWVETEVYESDTDMISTGQSADIRFPAFPGETWEGEVAYVYPELEPATRTLRLRIVLDNPDHRLKPNMFANVRIQAAPRTDVLSVPREAVIRSGRGSRVILALPDNRFRAQAVVTGISSNGRTEIREGLEAGQIVVTSGQFLLDSEANGEQALARLEGGAASDASNQQVTGTDAMAMDGMAMGEVAPNTEQDAALYSTSGRVVRIGDDSITLAHDPVAELGWPAMTMSFELGPEINSQELELDALVRFEFDQSDSGGYRIQSLTPIDAGR